VSAFSASALTAATSASFSTVSQKKTARSGDAVSMVSSDTLGFQESGTSIEIAVVPSSGILKTPARARPARETARNPVKPIANRSRRIETFPLNCHIEILSGLSADVRLAL